MDYTLYGTILVLLDISSAFDTLEHKVLIHRLSAMTSTTLPSTGSPPTLPTDHPQSGLTHTRPPPAP